MSNSSTCIEKIVVGIEDHEQSRDALSLAAAMARTLGSRLLVVAALDYSPLPIERDGYDRARAKHFARVFAGVEEFLEGIPHRKYELDRESVDGLGEFAAREGAGLIVIGSTHRGALTRAISGTVADGLLESAPCPLLVAPHGYAGRQHFGTGTIAVGYDGEEPARSALAFAEDLADDLDCDLRIVGAVPAYDGMPDPLRSTRESMYRVRVGAGRRAVTAVPATETVELGDAPHVLAAQGIDADLIVVGSHGRSRVSRAILGSVASELVRIAPCPVLVVATGDGHGRSLNNDQEEVGSR